MQLRACVGFIEEQTGRPYDWDRLSEIMSYTKDAGRLRVEAMQLCAAKPAPASFFDWTTSIAPVNFVAGAAPLQFPLTALPPAEHHGHQGRRAVNHRRVHHLPAPGAMALKQCGEDADRQQHPAATEVADKVEWGWRRLAGPPRLPEHPADRDVVEVVPRRLRERPLLPVSGHPAVDQAAVSLEARIRSESEPLGDPRTKALQQDVGTRDEVQDQCRCTGTPKVDANGPPSAAKELRPGSGPGPADALEADGQYLTWAEV
jgi:hypothetical protein